MLFRSDYPLCYRYAITSVRPSGRVLTELGCDGGEMCRKKFEICTVWDNEEREWVNVVTDLDYDQTVGSTCPLEDPPNIEGFYPTEYWESECWKKFDDCNEIPYP